MKVEELLEIINKDKNSFIRFVERRADFKFSDLSFKYVEAFRSDYDDHDQYSFIYKLGNDLFEIQGYYSSHDGVDLSDFELYKVEKREITTYEYVSIRE